YQAYQRWLSSYSSSAYSGGKYSPVVLDWATSWPKSTAARFNE
ncbi:hypothetical protein A2U01_0077137, partial [Trifolium medium]|nr:hypothetical protein [Trifolium medium]